MSVALDRRAKGHHEIYVFVGIQIPDVGAAAFLQYDWPVLVDCRASRRGVHAFNQRLLGLRESVAGFGAGFGGRGHVDDVQSLTAKRRGLPQRTLRNSCELRSSVFSRNLESSRATQEIFQSAVPPPSTTSAAPVMKDESSQARNSTALAISSAVPTLPSGRFAQPAM